MLCLNTFLEINQISCFDFRQMDMSTARSQTFHKRQKTLRVRERFERLSVFPVGPKWKVEEG